jgi:hypothetical protein
MYKNGTMTPVETILRSRGKGIKENNGGGQPNQDIWYTLL